MPRPLSPQDPYIQSIDAERKHLEGLFKDRINFHLVFASLFMVGLSKIDDLGVRVIALFIITIVSALMAKALCRTYLLVRNALAEIVARCPEHPYSRYQSIVKSPKNANKTLIQIPFWLSAFFLVMTIWYGSKLFNRSHVGQHQSTACTVFQTEDHSDRHVVNETDSPKCQTTGTATSTGKNPIVRPICCRNKKSDTKNDPH